MVRGIEHPIGLLSLSNCQHRGYIVECPQLRTCRGEVPPTATLEDDVSLIREIALAYIQQGRESIAIMHSYGGIVGMNALSGLGKNGQPWS